jgi:hypothetical protein
VGDEIHFSMETPGAVKVDSYLLPPPVSDESPDGQAPEAESASATNLAYEDLLEKLVLPTGPAAPDEGEAPEDPPPFASSRPSSAQATPTPLVNLFTPGVPPGLDTSDERTVVTANPLLAEEQEAAAREAETYILPAAPLPLATPVFVQPPAVAHPVHAAVERTGLALHKVIQISYQKLGIMLLVAMLAGGLVSRLMAPTRAVVSAPAPQTPTLTATPVVPAQPTQAANPAPQVVALPTPSEPPAASPSRAARSRQPSRQLRSRRLRPRPRSPALENPRQRQRPGCITWPSPRRPRPVKSAAPKAAPAKPAAPKKPAKGGWVDPFAQ